MIIFFTIWPSNSTQLNSTLRYLVLRIFNNYIVSIKQIKKNMFLKKGVIVNVINLAKCIYQIEYRTLYRVSSRSAEEIPDSEN